MQFDEENILEFVRTTKNKKLLRDIIEAANESLEEVRDGEKESDFKEKFSNRGVFLEFFLTNKDFLNVNFYLPDCEYEFQVILRCSEKIFWVWLKDFGELNMDHSDYDNFTTYKQNYREMVSEKNQELFDEVILYLIRWVCPWEFTWKNPFTCDDKTLEFIEEGFKLAKEMEIDLKCIGKEICKIGDKTVKFDNYYLLISTGDELKFIKCIISSISRIFGR